MKAWKIPLIFIVLLLLSALLNLSCGGKTAGTAGEGKEQEQGKGADVMVGKGLIAFVREGDIWIMDGEGGNPRNLTSSTARECNPAISPDGTRMAYTALDGHRNVYVIGTDGRGPTRRKAFPMRRSTS
ncbi:hypothetical protein [Candidatus Solincola tengchongensis]|uniref:hypothetical protein n=1 Tax=Candidatus Solincola tengchongensis TaxID=2900693 RepID=UPI00257E52FF|nr:hypothetical protein [Candidatus Solincola tengchongensis]